MIIIRGSAALKNLLISSGSSDRIMHTQKYLIIFTKWYCLKFEHRGLTE